MSKAKKDEQARITREALEEKKKRLFQSEQAKNNSLKKNVKPSYIIEELAEDNKNLLKAYKEKFKDEPKQDKNGNSVLMFPSEKAAKKFFKDLAAENNRFIVLGVDKNGAYTGQFYYSLGDGELHQGQVSPDKVNDLINKYSNTIKAKSPEDKKQAESALDELINPSKEAKKELSSVKENIKQKEQSVEEKEEKAKAKPGK